MYVVYGLINPITHQVFYVGLTQDLYTRYMQHLKCDGSNDEKDKTIQRLKRLQHVPEIWTLAIADTEEEGKRLEAFHIEREKVMKQPITNQSHWVGYKPTHKERQELSYMSVQTNSEWHWLMRLISKLVEPLLGRYLTGATLYDNYFGKEAQVMKDLYHQMGRAERRRGGIACRS